MTQTYKLSIFDETHHQLHVVNFPGTKSLLEVKIDISDLTAIPVRHQFWSGWPTPTTDDVIHSLIFLFVLLEVKMIQISLLASLFNE